MSARERLIAALEASPEVRPGQAEELVTAYGAQLLKAQARADMRTSLQGRIEDAKRYGRHSEARAVERELADREAEWAGKDTSTNGESTRAAARSAERLRGFFVCSTIGRREGGAR